MKINNINIVTGILFILFSFSSCEEDFLDKNPLDKVSSGTFWESESDLKMGMAGCYQRLIERFCSLNFSRGYMDGLTDIGFVYWGLYDIQNMSRGIITASSRWPRDTYRQCYKGIAACNLFIGNVDNAESVSESIRNKYKGEIKFIRAMFYFELAKQFGGVPLYKESPESPDAAKIAQSSREEVLAFVLEDLDYAIANLPDEPFTGHVVKGSAKGIKARVLLTQEKWSEAAALLKEIMDSGKFGIYKSYRDVFLNAGQNDPGNREILFSVNYLAPNTFISYGYNIEYSKHIFLRKSYTDYFECTDGLPITESPLYDPEDPWANRDPRHGYVVRHPSEDWPGFYLYGQFDPTGAQNKKYLDVTVPGDYANRYLCDWNFIHLRYADVLLMYAEAKNEASGPDASVYAAINEVRARPDVNMPPIDEARYNTKELLRDYIRHERAVELGVEGVRYDDLKRWKIAHTFLPTIEDPDGTKLKFEQKHYVWAFHQDELDANPNLTQNPGY